MFSNERMIKFVSLSGNFPDRWRSVGNRYAKPPDFPDFSDVKLLIDTILVEYQTGRSVTLEIERQPMICTEYLNNLLLSKSEPKTRCFCQIFRIDFFFQYQNQV